VLRLNLYLCVHSPSPVPTAGNLGSNYRQRICEAKSPFAGQNTPNSKAKKLKFFP
jgi:hypothetical protein